MYSYWKAENTAILMKEIQKQWNMKNVNNKPKVHNERKDENTVNLTKETRRPRIAKNDGSKCDLLDRLSNETDRLNWQNRHDRKCPVRACTNHVLSYIRCLDNGCTSMRNLMWLVRVGINRGGFARLNQNLV